MFWQKARVLAFGIVLPGVIAYSQDIPQVSKTLKVDVDLVTVDVSVTDPQGRYVKGLEREYFQLWEDKIEQKIEYFSVEDVPLSVGIIFDVSGSMEFQLSVAKDAAATFLKSGNRDDEYFLIEFSDRPKITQDITQDISRLQRQLLVASARGATSLYDAVYLGLEKLRESSNPKKALLLISDGEDNHSRYKLSDLKQFAGEQDVQIYSIGFETSLGSGAALFGSLPIETISNMTGGRAFFPASVNELRNICAKIAVELKSQYILGYRSTNLTRDGRWRKLNLKINPPKGLSKLSVRTKTGYYAAAN